jgi:hypothetical protein
LFFELYGKNMFIGRVWFEILWVGLFWLMQLAGAAALTAQGTSQFCSNTPQDVLLPQSSESPCASTQVLQAFTWIIAILMLGYFTLLSILTIVKYSDDPTILKCSVRSFPVVQSQNALKSEPASPKFRLSFRAHHPVEQQQSPAPPPPAIVAPQPRRHFAALRAAILAHRHSGGDEEAGHQRQTSVSSVVSPPLDEDERNRPSSYYPDAVVQQNMTTVLQEAASIPSATAVQASAPEPLRPNRRSVLPPATSTPFYNSAVRMAIDGDKPSVATPRPLPSAQPQAGTGAKSPSPPPLGDWPRKDATSRPRTKRKPTPAEHAERQMQPLTRLNMLLDRTDPEASRSTPRSQPRPEPQPRASSSRAYEPQPVASSSRLPDSGFAAQSWQQTYNHRKEPEPPRPVEVARQNSVPQAYGAQRNQQGKSHERPQRRPSASLPRPPILQARRTSESQTQAPYQALYLGTPASPPHPEAPPTVAPAPVIALSPPPAPAPTRKESQRRPLPVPQPQSPPASAPLARADSSTRPVRHLPPPPSEGAQVYAPTSVPPPSWRHRPGGPRRQSNDGDPSSPPPGLDRFNSIRSSDFSGQY